jgi:hypothetical protein
VSDPKGKSNPFSATVILYLLYDAGGDATIVAGTYATILSIISILDIESKGYAIEGPFFQKKRQAVLF